MRERFVLRKKKFLIGGIIIVLAIVYLAYSGFQASASYYLTVSETAARGSSLLGEKLRINGKVAADSITSDINTLTLKFAVTEGGQSLPVVYHGATPDNFRADVDVVIEGQLDSSGVFQANSILTKCPSKYVPQN
ncbi:MAG: hypothetical protein A2144_10445 [Chloroflexi bacterium RBG_16_50_9]|nr:MAG: hypothetical protein A2144_10445 [Chloroflexi bacterium RBG_16_50_9]